MVREEEAEILAATTPEEMSRLIVKIVVKPYVAACASQGVEPSEALANVVVGVSNALIPTLSMIDDAARHRLLDLMIEQLKAKTTLFCELSAAGEVRQ